MDHFDADVNRYCGRPGDPIQSGHAGPDPALDPLIGAPVPPSALPGLIIALIVGSAGGVSLGPEHPIMAVNIGLAVFPGSRILPRVGALDWTILASAGTIGALFGTPVAAALIFHRRLPATMMSRSGTNCLLP